jgi:hypothetical protein
MRRLEVWWVITNDCLHLEVKAQAHCNWLALEPQLVPALSSHFLSRFSSYMWKLQAANFLEMLESSGT